MADAGRKILLIDDDRIVRDSIATYLEDSGYAVLEAEDGQKGFEVFLQERPDLVITDIVMPYVSGVGIITVIKEKLPKVPVIAITAYGRNPERLAAEKQADVVLRKPFEMEKLKDHVAQLLAT